VKSPIGDVGGMGGRPARKKKKKGSRIRKRHLSGGKGEGE